MKVLSTPKRLPHFFFKEMFLKKMTLLTLSLFFCAFGFSQQTVKGSVTTSDSAVAGVTVTVKGSSNATQTDNDGKYIITAAKDAVLIFTHVGSASQQIPVKGRSVINVQLSNNAESLNQIVVVGYGTAKKATLTGSLVSVKGSELTKSPATNLSNSLAGRVAGVAIVTRSGEPGNDGSTFRIRGMNTLNDNTPLVVVDGIPGRSLERIDPADVESISILKDASAAIYGARAANGVILVTTKRGVSGKPALNLSYNQGFVKPTVIPKMADAATYAQMVNELNLYRGRSAVYTAEDIQKFSDGSDPWGHPNSNWYKELYKPTSQQRDAHLSVRGGNAGISYMVSAGYKYQDAIYRNSATNYSQGNFRSNIDAKVSDNIKLSVDILASQENRNYPTLSASKIYSSAMRGKPTIAARWPNGLPGPDIERGENPVVMATSATGYDKSIAYNFLSNARLDITIPWIKGLTLSGNASLDKYVNNHKLWQTPWNLYYWDGTTYDANHTPILTKSLRGYSSPRLSQDFNNINQTTLNGLINYSTTIGSVHNIKALLGVERLTGNSMGFSAARKNYISTSIDQLFAGGDGLDQTSTGTADVNARLNYFGRFNYNYKEKYLAEFVFRYDGSYIFPTGQNFGFFPGVSLGWVVSKEKFWNNTLSINNLKIRGSWGQSGNDRVQPYNFINVYSYGANSYLFNTDEENKALYAGVSANPNITWEIANQSNIGLDGQMLDGKIIFSFDYFNNIRSQILIQRNASVPNSSGIILPLENLGRVANRGFEFQLGINQKISDLSFSVSINGGYQKNKVLFFDETPGIPDYQRKTGHSMNSYLLFDAIGVFSDQAALDKYPHKDQARPGDIIFRDVNGDGKITDDDKIRNDKTDIPTFTGGLNIDLQYKHFYATILFQGASGAKRKQFTFSGDSGNYLEEDAIGRWTPDNTNATKPRAWNFTEEYWMAPYNINNTYWLRNNDYIRLKNVEIGYEFSKNLTKKAGLQGARIYFTGLNLATFTKLKNYDPETNTNDNYPANKVYNIGFNLTF